MIDPRPTSLTPALAGYVDVGRQVLLDSARAVLAQELAHLHQPHRAPAFRRRAVMRRSGAR